MHSAAAMTDIKRICAAGCAALVLILSGLRLHFSIHADAYDDRVAEYAEALLETVSGGDVQAWLNETLPAQTGLSTPDWYTMILAARGGYDHAAYSAALQTYLTAEDVPSATTRERMALALCACEPEPPAVCAELLDRSAGQMGIMSWVFALHLANNGVPSAEYTAPALVGELLARQAPDGGWSLQGDSGDVDVTAMTLQALAPYRETAAAVTAISAGVDFLAEIQLPSGAYQSFGTENPESTAQVWTALSMLGIDALSDGRFIKSGNTLLDGILQFRLEDGRFSHTLGGAVSEMATMQVYEALTAAELQQRGENLLLFHPAAPPADEPPQTEPAAVTDAPGKEASRTEETAEQTESVKTTVSSGTTAAVSAEAAASAVVTTGVSTTETSVSAEEIIHTTAPPADPRSETEKYPYRIPLTAAAAAVSGLAAVICLVRKRRSPKTYLTILGIFAIAAAGIWLIRIESPSQFYQNEARSGGGTVTMGIRCDVICGLPGSERFPSDGEIMPLTEFAISEDENALELLYDAVRAYGMQIEVDGVSGDAVNTAYVRGIASLYEFDFGDLSGWTYTVNGERPSVGCGACPVHDGDRIMWLYTINL